MRLAKRPILVLTICSALGLGACGGGDDGGAGSTTDDNNADDADDPGSNPDTGDDTDPDGDVSLDPSAVDHTYVVDSIDVPENATEVTALGLNIDGSADGSIDNALGSALVGLTPLLMVNVQEQVTQQIDQGGIILLADLKATDIVNAADAALFVFLGDNPNPAACESAEDTVCRHHLDGNGTFDISEDSPQDASIAGQIADGAFAGGPGQVTIQISISDDADPLQLTLIAAQTEANVAADGLSGKLGGAVTMENLFQALATVIAGIVAADASCTLAAPACCDAGTAKTILSLLDKNPVDCQVTTDELRTSPLLPLVGIKPDMDLLQADGSPGRDGTAESMSLGIGFDAVTGTFTPPASP